jgi:oxygen-dependent protoporphyrinogen oxidase
MGSASHVTVLEKTNHVGGWIQAQHIGDFFFEQGPRSLRICEESRATLALIAELGLTEQLIGDASNAHHRYLWNGKRLQRAPSSLWQTLTSPMTRDIVFTALQEGFRSRGTGRDESVYDFIKRRYSDKVASRLIDPMLAGIYAGNIHLLSAQACLPKLWTWEQCYGSILKGMLRQRCSRPPLPGASYLAGHSLFTLQEGLSALPRALAATLSDVRLGCGVKQLICHPDHVAVVLDDERILLAHHVVSALPAHSLAPLLASTAPDLSLQLTRFHSASLKVVHLGWRRSYLPIEGFGYLVPSCLGEDILGTVFDSSAFPTQNAIAGQTRLTVMLGGTRRPDLAMASDDVCITVAMKAIERHLGIKAVPDTVAITSASQAIPQYAIGHHTAVDLLRQNGSVQCPRLTILGSSFDGVATTSCINKALDLTLPIITI